MMTESMARTSPEPMTLEVLFEGLNVEAELAFVDDAAAKLTLVRLVLFEAIEVEVLFSDTALELRGYRQHKVSCGPHFQGRFKRTKRKLSS